MKHISLTVPELGLIAGTRAALGAGLALLLGDRLTPEQRRAVGWTLLAVGIVTTVPLVAEVLKSRATSKPDENVKSKLIRRRRQRTHRRRGWVTTAR